MKTFYAVAIAPTALFKESKHGRRCYNGIYERRKEGRKERKEGRKGEKKEKKKKRIVLKCQKINDFILMILINGKYFIDVI